MQLRLASNPVQVPLTSNQSSLITAYLSGKVVCRASSLLKKFPWLYRSHPQPCTCSSVKAPTLLLLAAHVLDVHVGMLRDWTPDEYSTWLETLVTMSRCEHELPKRGASRLVH